MHQIERELYHRGSALLSGAVTNTPERNSDQDWRHYDESSDTHVINTSVNSPGYKSYRIGFVRVVVMMNALRIDRRRAIFHLAYSSGLGFFCSPLQLSAYNQLVKIIVATVLTTFIQCKHHLVSPCFTRPTMLDFLHDTPPDHSDWQCAHQ